MKQIKLVTLLLCFCFVGSISLAQYSTKNKTDLSGNNSIEVSESLQLESRFSNQINSVSFFFCNNGYDLKNIKNSITLNIRPGDRKEICTIFSNKDSKDFEIIYGFTDGRIEKTGDDVGNSLCNTNITLDNGFAKLITASNGQFLLPGKEVKINKTYIKIPKNQTGVIYGCEIFKIKGNIQKAKSGSMFNIEVVKKIPIQINITGDIYNYGRFDDIQYFIIEKKQTVLKRFVLLIGLRLVFSIAQQTSKKGYKKHYKKG